MSHEEMDSYLESFKSRLRKKGYTKQECQKLSVILLEMYLSEMRNPTTYNLLQPVKTENGWIIQVVDSRSMFLNADLEIKYKENECTFQSLEVAKIAMNNYNNKKDK